MQWKQNDAIGSSLSLSLCMCLFGFRTFADLKNRFQLKWKKLALGRIYLTPSIKSSIRSHTFHVLKHIHTCTSQMESHICKNIHQNNSYFFIHQQFTTSTTHITIQLFEWWLEIFHWFTTNLLLRPHRTRLKLSINIHSIKWVRSMHLGCWPNRITTLNLYIGKSLMQV